MVFAVVYKCCLSFWCRMSWFLVYFVNYISIVLFEERLLKGNFVISFVWFILVLDNGATKICEWLVPRRVIDPGETFYYKIYFQPESPCTFNHRFTIEMTGAKKHYSLNCQGIVDIPRINLAPEALFGKENVIKSKLPGVIYKNYLYIKDIDVFDYGSTLVHANNKK